MGGTPRAEPTEDDINRGSWGNTGKGGCNSRGFSAGSRPASGHRHRASLDRRSRVLQKTCQVQMSMGRLQPPRLTCSKSYQRAASSLHRLLPDLGPALKGLIVCGGGL